MMDISSRRVKLKKWEILVLLPSENYSTLFPNWRIIMSRCSLTAFVEREGDGFVSLCPELDIASQGQTVEEASANLREAVELFLECADAQEVKDRLTGEVYISRFEVAYA